MKVLPQLNPPQPLPPSGMAFLSMGLVLAVALAQPWHLVSSQSQPTEPSVDRVTQQSFTYKEYLARTLVSQPVLPPQGAEPYVVQNGDTLEAVAARRGLTPTQILQTTPGSVDFLEPGQTIYLPTQQKQFTWPVPSQPLPQLNAAPRTSLDIAAPMGTSVVAAQAGTVITSGTKYNGYGQMIEILHEDGVITRYAHGSETLVRAGTRVTQGQPILRVGCTGQCRSPHIRFEVRVAGAAVDPTQFLP